MIFYASGAIVDEASLDLVVQHRIAVLTSFAYKTAFYKQLGPLSSRLRAAGVRLPYMIDSGAFTAWSKGKTVDMDALIDLYNMAHEEYGDCFDYTFVSLDHIPGKQGVARTAEDFRIAAETTVRNYEIMKKRVRGYVKPVYHDGEAEWVLRAYDDAPYISLSANQDMAYEHRRLWVAETAQRLAHKQLHGLAMTGTNMLRTCRWHSVDSAAWVLWAGYGAIAWLREDGSLKILPVSKESPRNKKFDGHIRTLPTAVRDRLVADLEAEGFKLDTIGEDSVARSRWNILVFDRACKWAASQPILEPPHKGFFE